MMTFEYHRESIRDLVLYGCVSICACMCFACVRSGEKTMCMDTYACVYFLFFSF